MMVPILFARADSVYKTIPGCDVFDHGRNALTWAGGYSCVAHPPCRSWGLLRKFANPEPGEHELAIWAVEQVRKWGGVLEHPFGSTLWRDMRLPRRNERDAAGGWTLSVLQQWWGHRAAKPTLLYIVGCEPDCIPKIPFQMGDAPCVVQTRKRVNHRPHLHKAEREHTPIKFALWLVELAKRCQLSRAVAV